MADISFDDLIPQQGSPPNGIPSVPGDISFDDLVPSTPEVPSTDANGDIYHKPLPVPFELSPDEHYQAPPPPPPTPESYNNALDQIKEPEQQAGQQQGSLVGNFAAWLHSNAEDISRSHNAFWAGLTEDFANNPQLGPSPDDEQKIQKLFGPFSPVANVAAGVLQATGMGFDSLLKGFAAQTGQSYVNSGASKDEGERLARDVYTGLLTETMRTAGGEPRTALPKATPADLADAQYQRGLTDVSDKWKQTFHPPERALEPTSGVEGVAPVITQPSAPSFDDLIPAVTAKTASQYKADLFQEPIEQKEPTTEASSQPTETVPFTPSQPPLSKVRAPQDIVQFIAANGGLKYDQYAANRGNLQAADLHRRFIPGSGMLVRRNGGMGLDEARRLASESGYGPFESVDDFNQALLENESGNRVFSANDMNDVVARQQMAEARQSADMLAQTTPDERAFYQLKNRAAELGVMPGPGWKAPDYDAAITEREAITAAPNDLTDLADARSQEIRDNLKGMGLQDYTDPLDRLFPDERTVQAQSRLSPVEGHPEGVQGQESEHPRQIAFDDLIPQTEGRGENAPESVSPLATEVSPLKTDIEPSAVLRPIEGTGEIKTRGLSQAVEAKAIENKLTSGFGDLPEYQAVSMADQAAKAADLITNDYEGAKSIAMGQSAPPHGLLPESVFVAVENRAIKDGDINTIQQLATKSNLSAEATTMGQRIRTLGERDPTSPVSAIQAVKVAREASLKARGIDKAMATQDTVRQIKSEIRQTRTASERPTWGAFIQSITCR